MTVSMADIPVLHSVEVVHFHYESWFTLSPKVMSLLTHYQERLTGFTMKSFKGLSNKLELLGLCGLQVQSPLPNVTFLIDYTHKERGHTIPNPEHTPLAPFWVTSNKLEKVLIYT
jgi:hypothetical protein